MVSTAWLLALAATAPPRDEFAERLAELASPRAEARASAERWLGANLTLERYAELADAALAGDAEVRGRLERVLVADERHLGLALELCGEAEAVLAGLGRDAVRASVARFDPRLGAPAVRGRELEFLLQEAARTSTPRLLRLDARRSLESMCTALELFGDLPLGVALDPGVATRTIRRVELELPDASWDELLIHVENAMEVTIEGYGLEPATAGSAPPDGFLRFVSRMEPVKSGVDLITGWLVVLATGQDPTLRVHAARSLAASGFTPALAWMDRLVRTQDDRAAREGLLRAAVHGAVAPAVLAEPTLPALLAEAETTRGAGSAAILAALARAGCFDGEGNPLAPRLLAGIETAPARSRWTRLFVLEQAGCAAAGEAAARALLAEARTPPALRLQALHVCAASATADPPRIEGLAEVFRLPLDDVEGERLGRELALLALPPPFRDPAAIPREWGASERIALLHAWLWQGELEPAAAHAAAWIAGPADEANARGERLADELRPWPARRAQPDLGDLLRRARELAPGRSVAVDRVRILLGLVPAADVAAVLEQGKPVLAGEQADLALLGALAGYPVSATSARAELRARLEVALKEDRPYERCVPLLAAYEHATASLYVAGRDEEARVLATDARTAFQRAATKSALAARFERRPWPPAPGIEIRDLAREESRFEVPASL